eukprot:9503780-Pyramimonas_sp.AAC.2
MRSDGDGGWGGLSLGVNQRPGPRVASGIAHASPSEPKGMPEDTIVCTSDLLRPRLASPGLREMIEHHPGQVATIQHRQGLLSVTSGPSGRQDIARVPLSTTRAQPGYHQGTRTPPGYRPVPPGHHQGGYHSAPQGRSQGTTRAPGHHQGTAQYYQGTIRVPPSTARVPPGYRQVPPEYRQGTARVPPGYRQGTARAPPSTARVPPGYRPVPSKYRQGTAQYRQGTAQYNQGTAQYHMSTARVPPSTTRVPPGYHPVPPGHRQAARALPGHRRDTTRTTRVLRGLTRAAQRSRLCESVAKACSVAGRAHVGWFSFDWRPRRAFSMRARAWGGSAAAKWFRAACV